MTKKNNINCTNRYNTAILLLNFAIEDNFLKHDYRYVQIFFGKSVAHINSILYYVL